MSTRPHYHIKHAEGILLTAGLDVFRLGKGEFFDLLAVNEDYGILIKVTRPGDPTPDSADIPQKGKNFAREIWHYSDYSHRPEKIKVKFQEII